MLIGVGTEGGPFQKQGGGGWGEGQTGAFQKYASPNRIHRSIEEGEGNQRDCSQRYRSADRAPVKKGIDRNWPKH